MARVPRNSVRSVRCLFLLFAGCFPLLSTGQGLPPLKIYEAFKTATIYSLVRGDDGLLFISSTRGLYVYDGVTFDQIKKDFAGRSMLAKDRQGTIYFAYHNNFGTITYDSLGRANYKSLLGLIDEKIELGGSRIAVTNDHVYCVGEPGIFDYNVRTETASFFPGRYSPYFFVLDNHLWVVDAGTRNLMVLRNGQFELAPWQAELKVATGDKPYVLAEAEFNGRERLISTATGLYAYSEQGLRKLPGNFVQNDAILSSVTLNKNLHVISSLLRGAVRIDSLGNVTETINATRNGLVTNSVQAMTTDQSGNLWIGSVGTKKVLAKADLAGDVRYWPKAGIVWEFARFNGKVYAGSFENLFEIDPEGDVRPIYEGGKRIRALLTFSNKKEERLLAAVQPDQTVVEFRHDMKPRVIYAGKSVVHIRQSKVNRNRVYVCDNNQLGYLLFEKGKWKYHDIPSDFKNTYVVEHPDGSLWVSNAPKNELIRLIPDTTGGHFVPKETITYGENDGLPKTFFYPLPFGNEVIFQSSIGPLFFNESTKHFEPCKLPAQLFPTPASISNIYCSPEDGSIYVQDRDKEFEIVQLKPTSSGDTAVIRHPFKRVQNKIGQVDAFAFMADNGAIWLSSDDFVMRYDPAKDARKYNEPFRCLIRKVKLDTTTLFYGYSTIPPIKATLPYDSGNLVIQFAAPFFDEEERTPYSYQLNGLDNAWSPWQSGASREYTRLPEGEYTFQVKAKNIYGVESNVATYHFKVLPPWYRTWLAYIGYLLLLVGMVYGVVKWRTHGLSKRKKELERLVKIQTKELQDANHELEASQEELRQTNEELIAINDYLQKAQRQLVESEKMASLGQLTAGIAHEINNPINFISGGVQAINSITDEFFKSKEHTTEMLEATIRDIQELMTSVQNGVTRTTAIVNSLRNFSSSSNEINQNVDVKECIDSSLILVKPKLVASNIEVLQVYGHQHRVLGNSSLLSQVFVNIFDNAIFALRNVNRERKITIQTFESEKSITLTITDNGSGIPDNAITHVFEPFFTTKDAGAGVGLGLFISYSIIEKHKGNISVTSIPGEETTFTIVLPAANK